MPTLGHALRGITRGGIYIYTPTSVPPVTQCSILLESGDDILLESGSLLLKESCLDVVFAILLESGDQLLTEDDLFLLLEG